MLKLIQAFTKTKKQKNTLTIRTRKSADTSFGIWRKLGDDTAMYRWFIYELI